MDVARLKTIPLFASFSEDDLRKIAPFAEEHSVGAGETIVREGDYSYDLMIIEEGSAEVRHDGQKIADLGPGDFFGEMGLLDKRPRNADVISNGYCHLLVLYRRDFERLLAQRPEMRAEIEAVAAGRTAPSPD